ncbi:MAG: hypothetical protein ABR928_16675 [Terracidiphilus sp.]|jgi:hypothetical protein
MSDIRPILAAPARLVPAVSSLFILRLTVSLLMTGADAGIVLIFAPSVFAGPFHSFVLRASFTILILGLAASLAHMWLLTYRAFSKAALAG